MGNIFIKRKFTKKWALSLTGVAIIGTGIAAGSGIAQAVSTRQENQNADLPPVHDNTPPARDQNQGQSNSDLARSVKNFFNKIKYTNIVTTNVNRTKLPSEVLKKSYTVNDINNEINNSNQRIPTNSLIPKGLTVEAFGIANDASGTLTISIALKQGKKYFNPTTGAEVASRGNNVKKIVISGYQTTAVRSARNIIEHFNKFPLINLTTTESNAQRTAKSVAPSVTNLATANAQIKDKNQHIPDVLSGFHYEISASSGTQDGTLIIKVALKKGNDFYNPETGLNTGLTKHTKDITVSGYQTEKQAEADKVAAIKAYVQLPFNTNTKSTTSQASTVSQEINKETDANKKLQKVNEQIAPNSPMLPKPPVGFEYLIETSGEDKNGKLFVFVSLKKTGVENGFFDNQGVKSETIFYKRTEINGYKK